MHTSFHRHTRGFTLIELMIVIAMILILMSISLFPYSFYMDRARVEKNIDMIAQEWVLAHNDVRNGILYSGSTYAHLSLRFQKGSDKIDILMSTGETLSERPYRTILLESGIEIIEIDGGNVGTGDLFAYRIAPPYARGEYSTGGVYQTLTGIVVDIGYPDGTKDSGRIREILLRPYYPY